MSVLTRGFGFTTIKNNVNFNMNYIKMSKIIDNSNDISPTSIAMLSNGTETAPSIHFSDVDSGFFASTTGENIAVVNNGAINSVFRTDVNVSTKGIQRVPLNNPSQCEYSFFGDGGTGLRHVSAGVSAIQSAGSAVVNFSSKGISIPNQPYANYNLNSNLALSSGYTLIDWTGLVVLRDITYVSGGAGDKYFQINTDGDYMCVFSGNISGSVNKWWFLSKNNNSPPDGTIVFVTIPGLSYSGQTASVIHSFVAGDRIRAYVNVNGSATLEGLSSGSVRTSIQIYKLG